MSATASERSNVPTFQRSNASTFERSNALDLSIIIVNWNTRDLLADCLRSVYDTVCDLAYEVFVVDNASADGSAAMVRERFPLVRLIENEENVGFARANNQALRMAQGAYILLLNSDALILRGALQELLSFMDSHPQVGACGPYLVNTDGTLQPSCHPVLTPLREFWRLSFLDALLPLAHYPMERWDLHAPRAVEVIKGACLLLRRAALDQIGLLDERYFIYTEEMDLCHRLSQMDWELYWVPMARVVHHGGRSTAQVAEAMYLQLYRSKVQFQRKFGGERRARLLKGLLALAYAPRWLVCRTTQWVRPDNVGRARVYRRLLAELAAM